MRVIFGVRLYLTYKWNTIYCKVISALFNDNYMITMTEIILLKILMETTVDSDLTLNGTINDCVILNNEFKDIQQEGGGENNKGIPVIKEDLSMNIGNALLFNDSDCNQAYTLYHIPQKHGGYIHNNNVLTINSTNGREMGLLFSFNDPGSIVSPASDSARLSMYRDISNDMQPSDPMTIYTDRTTFELAIADNKNNGGAIPPGYIPDRIIARKYDADSTFNIPDEGQQSGTKKYWDQYHVIEAEMALLDFDGKTKIGANNLVVGGIDVYKLLVDLAIANNLTISNYLTTGFIPDYRNKDNYREIEKTIDGTA